MPCLRARDVAAAHLLPLYDHRSPVAPGSCGLHARGRVLAADGGAAVPGRQPWWASAWLRPKQSPCYLCGWFQKPSCPELMHSRTPASKLKQCRKLTTSGGAGSPSTQVYAYYADISHDWTKLQRLQGRWLHKTGMARTSLVTYWTAITDLLHAEIFDSLTEKSDLQKQQ